MKRRQTLQGIGAVGVSAWVSGCSGILGGCGPGEDEIGTVAEEANATEATATAAADSEDAETVSITGEIQSLGERDIGIDDGTGTAKLTTMFGRATPRNVAEGDCVQATGYPYTPSDGSDADIGLLVETLDPA